MFKYGHALAHTLLTIPVVMHFATVGYPLCLSRARAGVWGVWGEPARNKARTNNRSCPASAVPPQNKRAGQDRASTGGCVKADRDQLQSAAEQIEKQSAGADKRHDRRRRVGANGSRVWRQLVYADWRYRSSLLNVFRKHQACVLAWLWRAWRDFCSDPTTTRAQRTASTLGQAIGCQGARRLVRGLRGVSDVLVEGREVQ